MTPQTATRMTYEEFMALPEEEGRHYELIEGELVLNPAPVPRHQTGGAITSPRLPVFALDVNSIFAD